jgi:hypothetical protein
MDVCPANCSTSNAADKPAWKEEAEHEWDELHPRKLIPEICNLLYHLGW